MSKNPENTQFSLPNLILVQIAYLFIFIARQQCIFLPLPTRQQSVFLHTTTDVLSVWRNQLSPETDWRRMNRGRERRGCCFCFGVGGVRIRRKSYYRSAMGEEVKRAATKDAAQMEREEEEMHALRPRAHAADKVFQECQIGEQKDHVLLNLSCGVASASYGVVHTGVC
jgi:hypothetical protein